MPDAQPITTDHPLRDVKAHPTATGACKSLSTRPSHTCTLASGHLGVHVHHNLWGNTARDTSNPATHYWVLGD